MGNTTFLLIPVVKGDISIVPDFPGGVRKLAANAVSKYFNKSFVTNIQAVSPAVAGVNSTFSYADPAEAAELKYESTLTAAAIAALDI